MGLIINQTYAKIGVERSQSELQIRSQNARLELHQKQAQINIHTEQPKIQIDQHDAFASSGLKNFLEQTSSDAQRGYQRVMDYIAKVAADGDRMAAIQLGGDAIAEIAARDAFPEDGEGLDVSPNPGPRFSVKGGISFDPQQNSQGISNGVEGSFTPGSTQINYNPSQVSISLRQYASINIRYQAGKIDLYT